MYVLLYCCWYVTQYLDLWKCKWNRWKVSWWWNCHKDFKITTVTMLNDFCVQCETHLIHWVNVRHILPSWDIGYKMLGGFSWTVHYCSLASGFTTLTPELFYNEGLQTTYNGPDCQFILHRPSSVHFVTIALGNIPGHYGHWCNDLTM